MSGYEEQELTAIDAAFDANPDATSNEVFQATRPYDERAIASVAASRALNGGGGSSSPVGWLRLEQGNIDSQLLVLGEGGSSVAAPVLFDTLKEQGGTGITWDDGDPGNIGITAGWYSICVTLSFARSVADASTAHFQLAFSIGAEAWTDELPLFGMDQPASSQVNPYVGGSVPDFKVVADAVLNVRAAVYAVTEDKTLNFTEFALVKTAELAT